MKSSLFDTRFSENDIELPPEVVYNLYGGIYKGPLAFWPEYMLDIVIPCNGNKNIGIPFWLLVYVFSKNETNLPLN